jgi:hypothetical protein
MSSTQTDFAAQPPPPPADQAEPARFDVGSFLAGLLFLALGVAFVFEAAGQWTFRLSHFRYVGPLVLVVLGLAILVGTGLSGRREDDAGPTSRPAS